MTGARNTEGSSTDGNDPRADGVVARFRPFRAALVYAVVGGCIALGGLVLFVASVGWGSVAGMAVGLLETAVFTALAVGAARLGSLGAVLRTTTLTTPRLMWGTRVIDLAEVTGVGLRYHSDGRASGWRLLLWAGSDAPLGIAIQPPNHSAPPGQRRRLRPISGFVPALDWTYLADTAAGRAAVLIARQVTAIQGPAGRLERQARQVTAPSQLDTAYWSPDGRVGPLPTTGRPPTPGS